MSLSANSINQMLEKYIKSSAGKQAVKQYKKDVFNGKKGTGTSSGIQSRNSMIQMGEKMKDILWVQIANAIPSFSRDGIILSEPEETATGDYKISVSFDEEAIHRESLYPIKYPEGVDNIVMLFTKGYDHVSGRTYGQWNGYTTWNKTSRESNDFLAQAVEVFNNYSPIGVKAELDETYK